ANKMPLTNKVAEEIVSFRTELKARLDEGVRRPEEQITWIGQRLNAGRTNAEIIWQMYAAQAQISEIPTNDSLLVEDYVQTLEQAIVGAEVPSRSRRRKQAPPVSSRRA